MVPESLSTRDFLGDSNVRAEAKQAAGQDATAEHTAAEQSEENDENRTTLVRASLGTVAANIHFEADLTGKAKFHSF